MPFLPLDPEIEDLIVATYLECRNISEVARLTGFSIPTVRTKLRKRKICTDYNNKPFDSELEESLKERFSLIKEGDTPRLIAKEFGVSIGAIKCRMKRLGIPIQLGKSGTPTRYTEKFHTLSDEALGYICGLIATDGNICPKMKQIKLGLKFADIDTVNFVNASLSEPPHPVSVRTTSMIKGNIQYGPSTMANVTISAPEFSKYLYSIGITPNKTKTLDPKLEGKSKEFLWYFLRGVIDGDGTIYLGKGDVNSGRSYIKVFSASLVFLEGLQEMFGGLIRRDKRHEAFYSLNFGGTNAKKLAEFLPKDEFTLTRKTERIKALISRADTIYSRESTLIGSIYGA